MVSRQVQAIIFAPRRFAPSILSRVISSALKSTPAMRGFVPAPINASTRSLREISAIVHLLPVVVDDLVYGFIQLRGRFPLNHRLNFADTWHTPPEIFKAAFVSLFIRHEYNLR